MNQLRTISLTSFPDIEEKIVTLILVPKNGSQPGYATKVDRKKSLLETYKDGDALLATWTGKWSSDCFAVTDDVRDHWRHQLGLPSTAPVLSALTL